MSRLDLPNVPGAWKFRACMAAAVLGLLCQIYFCFSYDIWFDESFSLQLIRHNYAEVISLTATDIHAPFYYLILKCVVDFGHLLFPGVSPIFFGKLVSVIPYLVLLLVCGTKVRRQYGDYVAGIGSVCLVCLRIEYGVEVRMYSFGLLFVTLAFIWLADVVRRWDWRAWTGFVIFSLCAAYTHTYALIAVSALWLSLLVYVCTKHRQYLKAWGIAAVVTVIGYLPWMSVLIGQVEHVSGGFWIGPLTLGSLRGMLNDVLTQNICLLGWLLFALLFVVFGKPRTCGGGQRFHAITGILALFFVLFVGAVASICVQPILIFRYLVPGLGCLWLGQLIAANSASRDLRYMLACMLLVVAALFSIDFIRSERYCKQRGAETMQFLAQDEEAVYVMDGHSAKHLHDIRVVAYMSQKYCLVDGWVADFVDMKDLNLGVFNDLHELGSCEELKALMSEGKHVYLLCDEDIESEKIVQEGQFAYEDKGFYKMGLFSANIYRLSCTEEISHQSSSEH